MTVSNLKISSLFVLIFFGLIGCEEQKEQALEYYRDKTQPEVSDTNLERFGFDEKATPRPTSKVVIPFDNERTRQDAKSF